MPAVCKCFNSPTYRSAYALAQFLCCRYRVSNNKNLADGKTLFQKEAEKYPGDGIRFPCSGTRLDQIGLIEGSIQEIKISIVILYLIQ